MKYTPEVYCLTLTQTQYEVLKEVLSTIVLVPPTGLPRPVRKTVRRAAMRWPSFIEDDGGRADAGFKGRSGDCVTRAFAIAVYGPQPTGLQYREVYARLTELLKEWAFTGRVTKAKRPYREGKTLTPRDGMPREVIKVYAEEMGFTWIPPEKTPQNPTGKVIHVRPSELPAGRLVLNLSRHLAAYIDHVLYDTSDSSYSRHVEEDGGRGWRLVSGYWMKAD